MLTSDGSYSASDVVYGASISDRSFFQARMFYATGEQPSVGDVDLLVQHYITDHVGQGQDYHPEASATLTHYLTAVENTHPHNPPLQVFLAQ